MATAMIKQPIHGVLCKASFKMGETEMAGLYVLVHGAWHTGAEMDAVAGHLRKHGHAVHCPTVAGNNSGDDRDKGRAKRHGHS